ncbi:hypothetical protein BC936DRAFT_146332 [Jimgerdemannia flammicorona]|uniref:Raptor N-terminal CASPase-like domain-containing protein n=1 Tax=Jimgerdemannia flammicorona TaxID=994334 RepID=A0A433D7W6_9FUNG|nr:hypothetical protein BC936DRAFT_146332 [Jimgerdemannia flammicorona]
MHQLINKTTEKTSFLSALAISEVLTINFSESSVKLVHLLVFFPFDIFISVLRTDYLQHFDSAMRMIHGKQVLRLDVAAPTCLLGLSDQELASVVEADLELIWRLKDVIIDDLEENLRLRCEAISKFYYASSDKGLYLRGLFRVMLEVASVNLMFAKATQLDPVLHWKRANLKLMAKNNMASKMVLVVRLAAYLQILDKVLSSLWELLDEWISTQEIEKHRAFNNYFASIVDSVALKMKIFRITVLMNVYDANTARALELTRAVLESREGDVQRRLQVVEGQLRTFQKVGDEFENVVRGYMDVLASIEVHGPGCVTAIIINLPVVQTQPKFSFAHYRTMPSTINHNTTPYDATVTPPVPPMDEDARSTSSTLVNGKLFEPPTSNGYHHEDEDEEPSTPRGKVGHVALNVESSLIRHGFEEEYFDEYINMLETVRYMFYTDKRHESVAKPSDPCLAYALQDWRLRERIKTVSGLLVVCLNIGVDPPDTVKTIPCAKLECWIDPFTLPSIKALEAIGKNLQTQYENINIRTRFKQSLDPSVEETKKHCCQLRRAAKDERILFHYNGHGVPKPTASGEIWVFNKNYTQYIPVSLFDVQGLLGSPVIYVWDCSAAGNIIQSFNRFADQRDHEATRLAASQQQHPGAIPATPMKDCIQLAACGPNEILPMNPDLPADVFTSCLTTPIEMSLRWFVMQNPLLTTNLTLEMVLKLPGRAQDRRTPLGELNWIFTAVTDTIAWNVLQGQPELFKRLFRQDLMVASMFRNFLLAERILRSHQCTPMSMPKLAPTHNHPMWAAWDLAVDVCLAQLPALLANEEGSSSYQYQASTFFSEQLTAFEVWLAQGSVSRKVPEQLPIVLQVLLSQVHRLRALILLSKFLDLGPWAVNAALSVGIFPYVLKLLQSPAAELKPVLVFIWARILAVDKSCQADLLKDNGYTYFINILAPNNAMLSIPHVSEHRAMCAFILSVFCTNFPAGQQACFRNSVLNACLAHVNDTDPLLRQWVCVCLAQLWTDYAEAKTSAINENAHEKLCTLLNDALPEVRAAALYALGTFIGDLDRTEQVITIEHNIGISALVATSDGSPIVRKELIIALSHIVHQSIFHKFVYAAYELLEEDRQRSVTTWDERKLSRGRSSDRRPNVSDGIFRSNSNATVYSCIWKALLNLSVDPHSEVANLARVVVDHVNNSLINSPHMGDAVSSVLHLPQPTGQASSGRLNSHPSALDRSPSFHGSEDRATAEAKKTAKLTRSATFTRTLRTLYNLSSGSNSTTEINSTVGSVMNNGNMTGYQSSGADRVPASLPPAPTTVTVPGLNQPRTTANNNSSASLTDAIPLALKDEDFQQNGANKEEEGILPLKSGFYDWSCEFFTEPQMRVSSCVGKGYWYQDDRLLGMTISEFFYRHSYMMPLFEKLQPAESEEPGSVNYNERLWRRIRNEKIVYDTQALREYAGKSRWDEQIMMLHGGTDTTHLLFHQFEPHLVTADDERSITVWNWQEGTRLNFFGNGNPPRSRITSLKFVNEEDVAMLLTGSGKYYMELYDGAVRLYRNYDNPEGADLVTAWRALTDLVPSIRRSGLVCDWQQGRGTLLIGGDVRDVLTRSGSCVTSITSDQVAGNIFVAGFGDGAVRVYDRRKAVREA